MYNIFEEIAEYYVNIICIDIELNESTFFWVVVVGTLKTSVTNEGLL